jgi:hypothetical protein
VAASLWATIANVIIQGNCTSSGSVSWFRAYHVGLLLPDVPSFVMSGQASERLRAIDPIQQNFFDIQVLRSRHIARARYTPSVRVTGQLSRGGRLGEFESTVNIHILAHTSGFVCIRPTIRFDQLGTTVDGSLLRHLERGLWDRGLNLKFHISELGQPLVGNLRSLLNWVFFDLITRWSGQSADPRQLMAWAPEQATGCQRLHQLVAEGRLDYAYPVSFGMQTELTDHRLSGWGSRKTDKFAAQVSREVLRGLATSGDVLPVVVEKDCRKVWWYVEENQALTLAVPRSIDPELDVVDADRTQLLEFLTIRRAALRSVQRETQRILADGSNISRVRVNAWYQIVTSTTDDYVLHDRIGQLITPLRRHYAEDRRLRELAKLEEQVCTNLDSFQRRLEASGAWISSVLGALVGAGALVIGLDSVTRSVLARVLDVPVGDLPIHHAALLSTVTVSLLALTFFVTYTLIRHASQSLKMRFGARRGALRQAIRPLRRRHSWPAGTRSVASKNR